MKKALLFLFMLSCFISCKKRYPDGPLISLRRPVNRIYGYYHPTKYTVNGADSLSLLNDSIPLTLRLWWDPVDEETDCFAKWYIGKGNYKIISSFWNLIDNYKADIIS